MLEVTVRVSGKSPTSMDQIAYLVIHNTGQRDDDDLWVYDVYLDGLRLAVLRHNREDGAFHLIQRALSALRKGGHAPAGKPNDVVLSWEEPEEDDCNS